MNILTNQTLMYWVVGAIALGYYWLSKKKGDPQVNGKNIALSACAVFIGLAIGAFLQGADPGALPIAFAASTGLAGGSTVKGIADARANKL